MPKTIEYTVPAGTLLMPAELIAMFKSKGFVFEREACPPKFAGTLTTTPNHDGSTTFVQTLDGEGDNSAND